MPRRTRSIAVVCLMVAACSTGSPGGPGPTASMAETARPTATVIASPTPAPAPTIPPTATPLPTLATTFEPAESAPPEAIAVQLGTCCALRFVPNILTAEAGTVALFLTNFPNEQYPYSHDIRIGKVQGQAIAVSPVLKNGETGLLTIDDLPAGDYVFWCVVNAHDAQGMVGTLTVTP